MDRMRNLVTSAADLKTRNLTESQAKLAQIQVRAIDFDPTLARLLGRLFGFSRKHLETVPGMVVIVDALRNIYCIFFSSHCLGPSACGLHTYIH